MFADGWGGSSAESGPAPASPGGSIAPELMESCRESTRRAERLVERLAPAGREQQPVRSERVEELGWAIRALEEVPSRESDG